MKLSHLRLVEAMVVAPDTTLIDMLLLLRVAALQSTTAH
jgi:hypothetical protein